MDVGGVALGEAPSGAPHVVDEARQRDQGTLVELRRIDLLAGILAQADDLVLVGFENHGGRISVHANDGRGASFHVSLPVARAS